MTKTEQKVYDYAQSVEWDYEKVVDYLNKLPHRDHYIEYKDMQGDTTEDKVKYFIEKHKPKQPESITLPIDDYNRLRKLEIKKQIKKLKKELKGL